MASDWPVVSIEEIAAKIAMGPFGSNIKVETFVDDGVPIISGAHLHETRVRDGIFNFITHEHAEKLKNSNVHRGDVIFTHAGTIGQVAYIPANSLYERYVISQRQFYLRCDPARADPAFIAYFFQSHEGRFKLLANASQVGVPSISRPSSNLKKIEIALPSLAEQREIAAMLGMIDDRIDLLRQTNATLEAIAQALFKSWFIDFDPVRAKAEGRDPEGMDPATAALFPSEFEDSPLGLIPKGWNVATLADHVLAERGLSYKGAGLCGAGEGFPMHNLNSVLEGGNYKYAGIKHYSGDFKDRHIAVAGDVIVANTEQGHEHRLIGFPAIIPSRYERAIYSHHIYRVRPKPNSPLTTHVLYYTLMAPAVREQVIGCANGSTVNMLKVAGLEIPQFVCPSAGVAEAFEDLASALRQQMEANVERSETLSALRDTLLPRLISGKLRLPEAEREIEQAMA